MTDTHIYRIVRRCETEIRLQILLAKLNRKIWVTYILRTIFHVNLSALG